MSLPVIEIYSSIECPFAYLATHRLRRIWPEYSGRVQIAWRALSLEYINRQGNPKPVMQTETALLPQIDSDLVVQVWPRPDWQWPVTVWPAFEALACAQAQSPDAAFEMSWAIRRAFFAEGRSLSLRHELLEIAGEVAAQTDLDLQRFEHDWDYGRYKGTVISESRHGWHTLQVNGSPTFVFADGRMISNPAAGEVDLDEANNILHGYTPYPGDPVQAYRVLIESALTPGPSQVDPGTDQEQR